MAAPVAKGDELELDVDSLAYGGNGVARLNGFVVFVRRGLPGDRVRARVTKVKRSHAEALATEVLRPGPERVDAPCAHFPACGGCRFQDLAYEAQLAQKEMQVRDALQRLAGIAEPPLEPIVPCEPDIFHYRNKLEYSFTATPEGPALGFHRAGRWDEVLEIERCWLTDELGNGIRDAVRSWAREEGLEAYSQADGSGYLRHLVVRQGRNTGQALVQLVTAPGERFETGYFVDVLRHFPEVRSIHWSVNDTPAEVTNLPTQLLWGDEWIEEELGGLRFRVRPNAFLQTNTAVAERLYGLADEAAGLGGGETVWDLYCGIGTIGLSLAREALTVWGIEVSEESVACALENAELNAITNAAFFAGNVGEVVEELLERSGPPDVVVVDPPRAGLAGKALRRLGRIGAPKLVYVSCNPTTLAGDVKALREEYGYELRHVTPIDMFPHTPHVEAVALLEHGPSTWQLDRTRPEAAPE
jgi:23S rRNA (uracil1939-C5)-methyltransferase